MKIGEMVAVLNGRLLAGEDKKNLELNRAYAADLLSDVLALTRERTMLVTGITSPQVIRVAELLDIPAIIFVRGKLPPGESMESIKKLDIPVIATSLTMFETCGLLYSKGVRPCKNHPVHQINNRTQEDGEERISPVNKEICR